MATTTVFVLLIIFVATLIRSTFGFGESLIAVPLLLFFLPINIAVPLSVLISISIAAIVVAQDREQIHFHSAKWLIICALPGIPVGLFILVYGSDRWVKVILGLLIVSYALYSLFSKKSAGPIRSNKKWLIGCGFISGVMGGAYGLNGPPLVIYGNKSKWHAPQFRATLQAYFLPISLLTMIGYWYKGLWVASVTHYYLLTLPIVIPTIFLGRYLNNRLNKESFFKYIYIGLICTGLLLMMQSMY